jgi:hypothetical protein
MFGFAHDHEAGVAGCWIWCTVMCALAFVLITAMEGERSRALLAYGYRKAQVAQPRRSGVETATASLTIFEVANRRDAWRNAAAPHIQSYPGGLRMFHCVVCYFISI